MNYKSHFIKKEIEINEIYTVHYFEFSKDYVFPGEIHDFWEIVYVDKGEVVCKGDNSSFLLKRGELIFHKPCEQHSMYSNGKTPSNIIVITFACNSECISFFEGKTFVANYEQRRLISRIVKEYTNAFETPSGDVLTKALVPREISPMGSQQLMVQYICELLITLFRCAKSGTKKETGNDSFNRDASLSILIRYMKDNIARMITVDEMASFIGVNSITVNRMFNKYLSCTPVRYFIQLKIEEAKRYLREEKYNVTQIAEMLGYANVHYFSKQFKKETGMSPTQYLASVKALNDVWVE